ncbi:hypothetical protein BCR42DRAFT_430339 [Absidia repens]|uniref:PARP-type domain-containing protein n=1 Tax=Absidia repens TaxID=90262 RepID=A0A1X2HH53_9FUNG|nr:hypothetical protein BCR42DRAFT_430339 [Absidia repens]
MATDATATKEDSTEPVRTLAFEYALSPNYQCNICGKSILRRTLCWTVPAEFKRKPLEAFRGYSKLKDTDKKKMQRLYEAGPGSSWPALMAADEEERLAAEEAEAEAAEAQQEEGNFTKKAVQNQPKPTKRKAMDDDEEQDMTKALTGAQLPTQANNTTTNPAGINKMKANTTNKKAKKNTPKKENESATAKKEKATKKKEAPKPAVKLDDVHDFLLLLHNI